MNKEQAIIQLEYRKDFATPDQIEALDMAISALSAIEKIRAEIEESHYITQDPIYARGLETALEIIDKHTGSKDK